MLHRFIFGLREVVFLFCGNFGVFVLFQDDLRAILNTYLSSVRFAQQEQAVAPELLKHSMLLFLNAIRVVVHSPSIVSFMVSSGHEAFINAEQFIRVFPTWSKGRCRIIII